MVINSKLIWKEMGFDKNWIRSVTVSETVPVRRSRRLAHMDANGKKLPSPEVSDQEMDTTEVKSWHDDVGNEKKGMVVFRLKRLYIVDKHKDV